MAAARARRLAPGLLLATVLVLLLADAAATLSSSSSPLTQPRAAGETQGQVYATALEVPTVTLLRPDAAGRALQEANETTALTGHDPRRRPGAGWDMVGPGLLVGGTLALLVLAAVGHLASKALLASMLSAALSAVQLARPPPPNRPG